MSIAGNVLKNGISGLKNKILNHEEHQEAQKINHWGHREHGVK